MRDYPMATDQDFAAAKMVELSLIVNRSHLGEHPLNRTVDGAAALLYGLSFTLRDEAERDARAEILNSIGDVLLTVSQALKSEAATAAGGRHV